MTTGQRDMEALAELDVLTTYLGKLARYYGHAASCRNDACKHKSRRPAATNVAPSPLPLRTARDLSSRLPAVHATG